jgi:hypothetical protein
MICILDACYGDIVVDIRSMMRRPGQVVEQQCRSNTHNSALLLATILLDGA